MVVFTHIYFLILEDAKLLEHIAFLTADKQVLVLLNGDSQNSRVVTVKADEKKQWKLLLPADSIVTAVWNA